MTAYAGSPQRALEGRVLSKMAVKPVKPIRANGARVVGRSSTFANSMAASQISSAVAGAVNAVRQLFLIKEHHD